MDDRRSRRARTVAAVLVAAAALGLAGCSGPVPAPPVTDPTAAGSKPGPGPSTDATGAPEVDPSGDIPDTQAYVPFTVADGSFTVSVPEGWARSGQGTTVVFTDKLNTVRIDTAPAAAPPDVASVRARELPALAATTPGFAPGDVTSVSRNAGPGVLATYRSSSPPDPVTGRSTADTVERYEFWHAGRLATLTLSGPVGADNVDPWRTVTDSLRWS